MENENDELLVNLVTEIERVRKLSNECFVQKEYEKSEILYSQAAEKLYEFIVNANIKIQDSNLPEKYSELRKSLSIILANRSAARFQLIKYNDALSDAEEAILLNDSWNKAYFRKASVLLAMGKVKDVYLTWVAANDKCVTEKFIRENKLKAQQTWVKAFLDSSYPLESASDLRERFQLLPNKRERLSTIVHFWNDACENDRLAYFQLLISIIAGEGTTPEHIQSLQASDMKAMPVGNYHDLPRSRMAVWCDYFVSLPLAERLDCLQSIWTSCLSSEEQNDVIVDLKHFIFSNAGVIKTPSLSDENEVQNDEEDDIDFSFKAK